MKKICFVVLTLCVCTTTINAQWSSGRPDGHAPIQVMGDHAHGKGEIMFSYRYMYMIMDGNGDETDELTNQDLFDQGYMVAPTEMPMQMHMVGAMYAVTDDLTLMLMLPLVSSEMDHEMANGSTFTTSSSGFGDIKLSGLYTFLRSGNMKAHANLGLSFPTGAIDEMDVTPMSSPNEAVLPYPMQIGSGTFDVIPGVTFLAQNQNFSFGAQTKGTLRLGENDSEYTLGNRFEITSWTGYKLSNSFSPMVSLKFQTWGDISGADPNLNPAMVHTADPELKAGNRLDLGLGLNIQGPEGAIRDLRFGVNYDLPIYQNLDGPQMITAGILTLGLQYTLD